MDYQYGQYAPLPNTFQPYLNGLPTPTHAGSAHSDNYTSSTPNAAQTFDNYNIFDYNQYSSGLPQPKPPTPAQQKPNVSPSFSYEAPQDMNEDAMRRGSNSDDEENMTQPQSRRKAQNRAAQRAFRERKEKHVKDLETKLAAMERKSSNVSEENERLRLQLQKAATENKILKAASGTRAGSEAVPDAGLIRYSPTDFYTEVLHEHENKVPSHRIVTSENGDRLLAVGATWDYIIKHPLYTKGMVDVGNVSVRLKQVAKCDGQGPVFQEREIIKAIEQSVASGSDELL
ncbi:hypothetical protein BJ878DRAFT_63621 [Calycina marina]|uniref:BZIP domain-containing protein n=1 Tax=Calycina marina TaxID=1763456 RepID=A0A9P7Z449_9HELO|nr:hypothetical protein BJ878DRAFT_63621 [Calycina marina]